jgi:hypothetical protein
MTIEDKTIQLILTFLGVLAGGSGVAGVIIALSTKKKSKAETANIIQEAAGELIEKYRAHNKDLITECVDLKSEMSALAKKVEENSICQGLLTEEIRLLKNDKVLLIDRVKELETRLQEHIVKIQELENENQRLKKERLQEKELLD